MSDPAEAASVAPLNAVKALHKRYWHSPGGRHYCDHCRNHVGMHRVPWPCPTMQAAAGS